VVGSAKTGTKSQVGRWGERNSHRSSRRFPTWLAVAGVAAVLLVLILVARRESGEGTAPSAGPGLSHVHGLGVNPANGDLYAATHFGLLRVPPDGAAQRVGESLQDVMGFTVVGPDHFMASGHPDIRDQRLRAPGRPPLLGLVESRDGGRSWEPVSLLGEADFHALVAAHANVYGYDSTAGRFMVSRDGKQWDVRSQIALADFAVDPAAADHLVATTGRGLAESRDGGRSWEPVGGPQLAFVSWGPELGLWGLGPNGETYQRVDGGWEPRQKLAGEPQALLVGEKELFAATSQGKGTAIYASSDGARSWRLRYSSTDG
jgi:hypothetical protein